MHQNLNIFNTDSQIINLRFTIIFTQIHSCVYCEAVSVKINQLIFLICVKKGMLFESMN